MTITFVLPGDERCGGVRVTVAMANALLQLGHCVRLAYPRFPRMGRAWLKALFRIITVSKNGGENTGWVREFAGKVETFTRLDDVHFTDGEMVIAVGTFTIERVYNLKRNVIKLRYNHGLPLHLSDKQKQMWALPIPTIAVSGTIVPELESLTGQPVLSVIPNGIDLREYHQLPSVCRDGIGTVYGEHPSKAPADTVAILTAAHRAFPDVPQYVFGTSRCPPDLSWVKYHRLPSVMEACELYNRAKVWLVTSHTEGFALPILEAMACGCAVISTDTYGGRELIRDAENGLLVRRGDVQGFVTNTERLLADHALRRRLVAGGMVTAKQFTWESAAAKMDTFLHEFTREGARMMPVK